MATFPASQYLIPAWGDKQDTKLGWLKEAMQDGEAYLKNQRNYKEIDRGVDIISGYGMDRVPKGMSRVHFNMIKRDAQERIATLANMRPTWGFKTDNNDFQEMAQILNKLMISWYLNTYADRKIRVSLQYADACGLGWASPYWKNDFWSLGRGGGDIDLQIYGPRDVIPYNIGRDHDIQRAYVVTIRNELPLPLAFAKYPTQIDLLSPDRSTPTWMRKGLRQVQKFLSPVLDRFGPGRGKETDDSNFPTVDIFESYVLDPTFNDTDKPIQMGEPGTKWSYTVPPYKSDIPTGVLDTNGKETFRKATAEDAMLFPLRRQISWTNHGILRDNTGTNWHARVPIIPFQTDDWPWDFIGTSVVHNSASIQEATTSISRAIVDSANARLDPALQYDENTMSQGLMERFNPRASGQRMKYNAQMGEGVKPVLQSSYYDVPTWITQWVDSSFEKMHYILGTRDIAAIAKARQLSGDSAEKIMELAGPIVTDMSRNMERSMREIGEQWKCLAMQYYDLPRRVQVLGKDGVTEEDFDYDPGTMIPSHLPDEFARMKTGALPKNYESRASRIERARAHLNSCYFYLMPNSLHQITNITQKMLNIQLFKSGFPIDPWTVGNALDIANFGTPEAAAKVLGAEKAPSDVFGRWLLWKELLAKIGGDQAQKGRKPSGQQQPTLQSKDGGSRSTVRESPR